MRGLSGNTRLAFLHITPGATSLVLPVKRMAVHGFGERIERIGAATAASG